MTKQRRAVSLISGGLDSTTVLAMARSQGYACYTLSFDYGQRHRAEIDTPRHLAAALGIAAHKVMDVTMLGELAISALTRDDIPVSFELQENGLPNTFVPGRNILFLTLAAIYAYQMGAEAVILGCTEIGMLVTQADTDTPLFDTTEIHANAAVTFALK